MKAVRIHSYGSKEVLQIDNIDIPVPEDDELLVKIKATSINPVDWKIREGYLKGMNLHQLPLTLGWDFSGIVEKAGSQVADFTPGDEVYSRPAIERNGTYAEYIVVKADEVALKPLSISHEEAASIPLAGITAWESLVDRANISAGQKVLVHAASGGVGTLAVQIAKSKGCYVIGTCSSRNVDFVKELGVDEVIDYSKADFSEILKEIDVVFDTVGGKVQEDSWKVLKKGGILVSITNPPSAEVAASYGVRSEFVFIKPSAPILSELSKLIDAGKLNPVVSHILALDQIKEAHELSQTGRTRGKIVIKIAD